MSATHKSPVVPGKHKDKTLQGQRFQEGEDARAAQAQAYKDASVSPPGEIPNLPPLLEARRLKYGIPDQMFASHPCNNKVYVFQMEDEEQGMFGGEGGSIHMPEAVKERRFEAAPKGILLGGGLKAMDQMYANGYWVGHVVRFIAMNPWRLPVATIGGKGLNVLVMTAGDIVDSNDLAAYLRTGAVKHAYREYELDDGEMKREYYLEDTKTGRVWDPSTAEMTEGEANAE